MRRKLIGVAALGAAVLVPVASAAAQGTQASAASGGVTFAVFGGAALPVGSLGDGFNTGFRLGGGVGFQPAMLPIGLRADLAYDRFGGDKAYFGSGETQSLGLWSGSLNPLWSFPVDPAAPVRPYILGNVGIYHQNGYDYSVGGQTYTTGGATKFGLGAGGGIDFSLAGFGAFMETKLISVFTEGSHSNFVPVVVGLRFGGGSTTSGHRAR